MIATKLFVVYDFYIMFNDATLIHYHFCRSVKYSVNIFHTENVQKLINVLLRNMKNPDSDKLVK